jgi:hypothetical protein
VKIIARRHLTQTWTSNSRAAGCSEWARHRSRKTGPYDQACKGATVWSTPSTHEQIPYSPRTSIQDAEDHHRAPNPRPRPPRPPRPLPRPPWPRASAAAPRPRPEPSWNVGAPPTCDPSSRMGCAPNGVRHDGHIPLFRTSGRHWRQVHAWPHSKRTSRALTSQIIHKRSLSSEAVVARFGATSDPGGLATSVFMLALASSRRMRGQCRQLLQSVVELHAIALAWRSEPCYHFDHVGRHCRWPNCASIRNAWGEARVLQCLVASLDQAHGGARRQHHQKRDAECKSIGTFHPQSGNGDWPPLTWLERLRIICETT